MTIGGRNSEEPQSPSFFVFGPERSGTTLLAFLLSGQPKLFCVNDSFAFRCYVDSVMWTNPGRGNSSLSSLLRIAPELVPELLQEGRPEGWSFRELVYRAQVRKLCRTYSTNHQPSAEEVDRYVDFLVHRYEAGGSASFLREYRTAAPNLRHALSARTPSSLQELFSVTIGQLSKHFSEPQSSRAILGEKTPVHTFYWKWILETLYPESCGIVVVRHPVTNISSILKRAPSLSAAEARYLRFSRAVVDLANHPRVTVIKYEDLVESPGSAIESAVRFIGGTEFDPSLRLVSYAKGSYTGDRIDPSRNPKPDETLRREDRARIRRRFDQIYSAFQYD